MIQLAEIFSLTVQLICVAMFFRSILEFKFKFIYTLGMYFSYCCILFVAFFNVSRDSSISSVFKILGVVLFSFVLCKGTIRKKALAVLGLLVCNFIGQSTTVFLFKYENIYEMARVPGILNITGVQVCTFITYLVYIIAYSAYSYFKYKEIKIFLGILIPAISQCLALYIFLHSIQFKISVPIIIINITYQYIFIFLEIFQYIISIKNIELNKDRYELSQLKSKMDLDFKYYELANEKFDDISKLRHDVNNQIQTIKLLYNNKNDDEAKRMIEALQKNLSDIKVIEYCNVPIINTLVTLKFTDCRKYNIESDIFLKDCEKMHMEDSDICSLICNLFDNAIEACKKIENETDRYIKIRSAVKDNYFIIKMENSYNSKQSQNKSFYNTKKIDGHGYGLKIVKSIVQKYNSEFEIINSENKVSCVVVMKAVKYIEKEK